MDNNSENDKIENSNGENQPNADNLGNKAFDLDFLSGKIQETIDSNQNIQNENNESPVDPFMQSTEIHKPLPDVHVETSVKKYVIHVDPENVDYMEHLTINERRQVINSILKEQSFLSKEEIKAAKLKKKMINTVIMVLTFLIFFPLLFIAITSSAKLTLATYSASKSNFSKLYRENGIIKRKK